MITKKESVIILSGVLQNLLDFRRTTLENFGKSVSEFTQRNMFHLEISITLKHEEKRRRSGVPSKWCLADLRAYFKEHGYDFDQALARIQVAGPRLASFQGCA